MRVTEFERLLERARADREQALERAIREKFAAVYLDLKDMRSLNEDTFEDLRQEMLTYLNAIKAEMGLDGEAEANFRLTNMERNIVNVLQAAERDLRLTDIRDRLVDSGVAIEMNNLSVRLHGMTRAGKVKSPARGSYALTKAMRDWLRSSEAQNNAGDAEQPRRT
jgi:restriction endonuclease Mrr